MGTNYFARVNLGGPTLRLHIGKASFGWCFGLHVTDEITSLDDWRAVFAQPSVTIVDEYGETFTPGEMLAIINERSWTPRPPPPADWLRDNHASVGPLGLVRRTYKATLPPNPATDTYDLCTGDFS